MKKRLLVLVLLIVSAAGLMFWSTRRPSEVVEIHRLGGMAFYDASGRSSLSWVEDRIGSHIFSKPYEAVDFYYDTLTDDDFVGLRLTGVKTLHLQCPRLTIRSARHIATLKDLERLYIATNNVDDEWIVEISTMKRLVMLNVSGSQVSDRSATAIRSLPSLKNLAVAKSHMTRAGLLVLLDAPALESIAISPDQWSEEFQAKLRAMRPIDLMIYER